MTISQLAAPATRGGALLKRASFCLKFLSKSLPVQGARLGILFLLAVESVGICQAVGESSAVLAWDPNPEPDIAGYRLHYGTAPGIYDQEKVVLDATEAQVQGLKEGTTYYFSVAAFNHSGQTGPNSDEISHFVEPEAPTNHAPVAKVAEYSAVEDTPFPVQLVGTDPDGNNLTYSIVTGPAHGSLIGSAPNITYIPAANYHGPDQFTFQVSDGPMTSAPATVYISISPVNDAPVVADNSFMTGQNSLLSIHLTGEDVEKDNLTFTVVTQPAHGKLSGKLPDLVYTPDPGFSGDDTFTFKANDGSSDSKSATISIAVSSGLPLTPNSPPVFSRPAVMTAAVGQVVSGRLSATDPDGDPLVYSKISGASWLTVSPDGAFLGTARDSDIGDQVFGVRVEDPSGGSATASLSIRITRANHAPVFAQSPLTYPSVAEKATYAKQSLASAASDPDSGDRLTFSKLSGPSWLRVASNGSLSGKPGHGSAGTNRFTVRVTDNHGAFTDSLLTIQVVANQLPLPWKLNRLGDSLAAEPATYSSGIFTLGGSGSLVKKKDSASFSWQTLSGDGSVTARIRTLDDTGEEARVGLMIRQSLATDARQAFIGLDGNGKLHWLRRANNGGASNDSPQKGSKSDNTWLRLKRNGDTIVAYRSSNGKKWEKIASSSLALPKHCYVGLSVSSGDGKVRNTSRFSNVRVQP